jgi:hypothetical protein
MPSQAKISHAKYNSPPESPSKDLCAALSATDYAILCKSKLIYVNPYKMAEHPGHLNHRGTNVVQKYPKYPAKPRNNPKRY